MVKRFVWLLCLVPALLSAQNNIAGDWLVTTDIYGHPLNQPLTLQADAGKLTGSFDGFKFEGTFSGSTIHFALEHGGIVRFDYTGTVAGNIISGNAILAGGNDPSDRKTTTFTARRLPQRPPGPVQRHEFIPTAFYTEFSAATKPVLTIWPGDTVHTSTVDAFGRDEHGVGRASGSNPQTGPFYVGTAVRGDVLAVHFTKVRLNRDWALSDDAIMDRAVDRGLAAKLKDRTKNVRWRLDRQRGVASPEEPSEHLKNFTVPLRPMLGCVAVASGSPAAPSTGDSGQFGGNMDFNEIVEGTTVYLRVEQPGALLYVGDGHAAQGDGELTGNALETSMEVEFTVDLLPHKPLLTPRIESATHIMALGLAGSLDDAFRSATSGLVQWLEQDYKLTPSEIAQVLGSSIEYVVNEVADRNVGIVAKLNKERLAGLTPPKP